MTTTDSQLKQALAKMLQEQVHVVSKGHHGPEDIDSNLVYCDRLYWGKGDVLIHDTELLHLCWLVEQTLDNQISDVRSLYLDYLGCIVGWNNATNPADAQFEATYNSVRADWRPKTIALAKVKEVEIV